MLGDRRQLAHMQSDFYKHKYLKMLRAINILTVILLLLILIIIYFSLTIKAPDYYATTTQGRLIPMQPKEIKR